MVQLAHTKATLAPLLIQSHQIQTAPAAPIISKLQRFQRRLSLLLRSVWGESFIIKSSQQQKPHLEQGILYLPEQLINTPPNLAEDIYRGMAHHLAAHIIYTPKPLIKKDFSCHEQHLINLLDDARIEYKATQHEHTLSKLWLSLLRQPRTTFSAHPTVTLLEQISLGLATAEHQTSHIDINHWLADYHHQIKSEQDNMSFFIEHARQLLSILRQYQLLPNERLLTTLRSCYRDDNRLLWQ